MLFTLKSFKKKKNNPNNCKRLEYSPCMRSLQREIKKEADHNRMVGEGKLEASHWTLSLKKNRKQ